MHLYYSVSIIGKLPEFNTFVSPDCTNARHINDLKLDFGKHIIYNDVDDPLFMQTVYEKELACHRFIIISNRLTMNAKWLN